MKLKAIKGGDIHDAVEFRRPANGEYPEDTEYYFKSEADEVIAEKDKELDRVRMEHHRERDEYISMVYSQKKEIERLESAVAALKGELYELRHR